MTTADTSPPTDSAPEDAELSVDAALSLAGEIEASGDLEKAKTLCKRILAAAPNYPPAVLQAARLSYETGDIDAAVDLLQHLIRLCPGEPGPRNNLANIYSERGQPEEALAAYRLALERDPRNASIHNNLGVVMRTLGHIPDAEASYRRALEIDPTFEDALNNLGRLLAATHRLPEAIACYLQALELEPRNAQSRNRLLAAYTACGEQEKALATVTDWLDADPSNPTARHLAAAISGTNVPDRAADDYVEAMFDRFAANFDTKLARLHYRAPHLVAAAVGKACGPPASDLDILDAGCGTGLCGPFLAPFKTRLVGVDLSPRMLARARERGGYDELARGELSGYMAAQSNRFDLIVSADTLCYFGSLTAVCAAAAHALRSSGVFIFSVEDERDPVGFRLNPHGRYSHHVAHVRAALRDAGLLVQEILQDILREEVGVPVQGLVVTARKPAS